MCPGSKSCYLGLNVSTFTYNCAGVVDACLNAMAAIESSIITIYISITIFYAEQQNLTFICGKTVKKRSRKPSEVITQQLDSSILYNSYTLYMENCSMRRGVNGHVVCSGINVGSSVHNFVCVVDGPWCHGSNLSVIIVH